MPAVMREGAYRGGSRMAADWDRAKDGPPEPVDDEHQDVDEPEPDEPDDDEHQDDDEPAGDEGQPAGSSTSWGQDGAGWVLGLLAWGWLVLPFLQGGPGRVKAVLAAKFLNRAADGSELP